MPIAKIIQPAVFSKQPVKHPRRDLDFERLARCCLDRGAHQLSPDQIKFIGGLLQQIPWCGLTTEQSNDYLISQSW
jgi:hypothetical protein